MADKYELKAVLSAKADGMIRALKQAQAVSKNTRKYLLDVGSAAGHLGGKLGLPLTLLAGAASAFSFAGLQHAITSFAELGDEVAKSSQRIGVSIPEYQQLKYIAGQSGVSVEELTSSMGRLNKGIGEAVAGKNKDLAALFKKAGIAMRDSNGQMRSAASLLPEVADLFQRNTNAAVQARMGNAIFGKSWQALAPLLQGGSDGVTELTKRYERLGLAIDEKAIKAGEAFGDSMDDAKAVVASYGHTIAAKLMPTLGPMLDKFTEWLVLNRDLIATKVAKYLEEMAANLQKVDWSGVIDGVNGLVDGVRWLVDKLGGAKNALIALAVVMNIQTLMAVGSLIGACWRLGVSLKTSIEDPAVKTAFGKLSGRFSGISGQIKNMPIDSWAKKGAKGIGGMLGPLSQLAEAFTVGYAAGTLLNEGIDWMVQKLTDGKSESLGSWIYDITHADQAVNDVVTLDDINAYRAKQGKPPLPARANQQSVVAPPLVNAGQQNVTGRIGIDITGAPAGTRVTQVDQSGPVALAANVGYRSYATGMP